MSRTCRGGSTREGSVCHTYCGEVDSGIRSVVPLVPNKHCTDSICVCALAYSGIISSQLSLHTPPPAVAVYLSEAHPD